MTDRHFADVSALRHAVLEAAEAFCAAADPVDMLHAIALLERYRDEQSWEDAIHAQHRNPPQIGFTLSASPHQSLPLDTRPREARTLADAHVHDSQRLGFTGPKVVSITRSTIA